MSTTVTDQTPSPTADAHAATCARAALVTADAGRQEPFGDLVEVEKLPDGQAAVRPGVARAGKLDGGSLGQPCNSGGAARPASAPPAMVRNSLISAGDSVRG